MESPLTKDEIAQAIRALRPGKALGPNGLPIELYKLCPDKLAPQICNLFEKSRETGILPRDQRLATIVTIHKEGKPRTKCASYRPISLLNVEPKILAKVIGNRLIKIITTLIHPDQSGFMPQRNTALNI